MAKNKKKKVRVAFRKNRQKRARDNKLTRRVQNEELEETDLDQQERVSGKGHLSRFRTVVADEVTEDGEIVRQIDESQCMQGRVVSAIGLNSKVYGDDGNRYECTIRRVVRTLARNARNAVVTGDIVLFQPGDNFSGVIERVNPRKGIISRFHRRQEHIIVANVDQVLIVVSADEPPLKPNLIDRFLISAEKGKVKPVICINKVDLVDLTRMQLLAGLYGQIGYDVILVSASTGYGMPHLRNVLKGKESVFTGQSGVGKSTLLNVMQPGLLLDTSTVSEGTLKGRHTTRRAILLDLKFGGWVVDTPGIRQFGLWDVLPEEVEGYFIEFRPFVIHCQFPDCTHTHEKKCGVKQAVQNQIISEQRYYSYVKIMHDQNEMKEENRHWS